MAIKFYKKADELIAQFTFNDILDAQASQNFSGHREFVAWIYEKRGYIITNFELMKHETWQDGDKKDLNITHKVFGKIGRSIMKI